jgi:cellobiose-specific phosphotransferase system component IIB
VKTNSTLSLRQCCEKYCGYSALLNKKRHTTSINDLDMELDNVDVVLIGHDVMIEMKYIAKVTRIADIISISELNMVVL